jgi:Flp pilus assembly protein TadD
MVNFQGTDEIGHVAGQFAPPKLPSIPEGDYRRFSGAVEAIYVEHDRILGRLRERALRDGATLLLASDHGFRLGDDRPVSAGPGVGFDTAFLWHRDPGMMAAEGPGVVPARERGKANVFDVAPTLCRLLGLPPDPAFEGRPASGLGGPGLPDPVPAVSWEKSVRVERLVPRERPGEEDREADEFTRKLIALGYLTGPRAAAVDARPSDRTGTETAAHQQNLATFLRARGRAAESLPYYEKALEIDPGSAGTWMNYSLALLQTGRWGDADDALVRALASGLPDGERAAFRRVSTWVERISKRHAERKELIRFLEALGAAFPSNDRYRASLGATLLEDGRCADSTALLAAIVSRQPRNVEVLNLMAVASECLGRIPEAREWFERSLAVKPDQPEVREAMARMSRGGVPPK